eukprot:4663337-Pyramimonas_sp.AAC.1
MKDDVAAALKIKEYERKNPKSKPGKKRGTFDHIGFQQRWKARHFSNDFVRVQRMDFIEYPVRERRRAGERMEDEGRGPWNLNIGSPSPE